MTIHQADRDPTPNHDGLHGFEEGQFWHNRLSRDVFICVNAAEKAAEWTRLRREGAIDYQSLENRPRLGNAAERDVGSGAHSVAAGDDERLIGALQRCSNLRDVESAGEARKALGAGSVGDALFRADGTDDALRTLGLEGAMSGETLRALFQPLSGVLMLLARSKLGRFGLALLACETEAEAQKLLRLVPGKDVQPYHLGLDRAKGITPAGERIIQADTPGAQMQALGASKDLKEVVRRLEELGRRIAEIKEKRV